MNLFRHLKLGLGVVLVFIGTCKDAPCAAAWKIDTLPALLVVATVLAISIIASLVANRCERREKVAPSNAQSPAHQRKSFSGIKTTTLDEEEIFTAISRDRSSGKCGLARSARERAVAARADRCVCELEQFADQSDSSIYRNCAGGTSANPPVRDAPPRDRYAA